MVRVAGDHGGASGLIVQITLPDGSEVIYAHLSEIGVKVGDEVTEGQTIGKSGESGNAAGLSGSEQHVHFGVKSPTGTWVDPVAWINSTPGASADDEPLKSSLFDPPMEPIRWSDDFTNPVGNVPRWPRR